MLAFKYISFHYLKYFAIILTALVLFMVGFDYMGNAEGLEMSANLMLIYIVYKSFYAIKLLLPLSLIFAMISTKILLIRSNALVSFYSLGYSRVDILRPFVAVSTLVIIIFIGMHSVSAFARSNEFAKNIAKHNQYLSPTRDLFFTHKERFIYISKMLPLQEKAEDIRIFTIKNHSLTEVLVASSAIYKDGAWFIKSANIIKKPNKVDFESSGIRVSEKNDLYILEGFRPKMLDQVYEGKVNYTIKNAIDALILLREQHINTDIVRSALYKIFIYPFFVPSLVIIIFFFVPISSRFLNVSLFSFGAILASLLVWAVFFILGELSNNKVIDSEIGIVFPVVILFLISIRQWRKYAHSS